MDAMRTRRERHIESIVDQHACAGAANRVDTGRHQTRQRTTIEIALTNLNEVHALRCHGTYPSGQRVFPRRAKPSAIGHQAQDGAQAFSTFRLVRGREA